MFVRDSVSVETEWQSWVLSLFLVLLSHSKSHGFYSMPGSSSFWAAPPVNKQDLYVFLYAFVCLNNTSHFLFLCFVHNVYTLALSKYTV